MQRPYIAALTALRGIAAVMVVMLHLPMATAHADRPALLERGYLWVDFFFLLSGFIIAYSYGARFDGQIRRPDLREFLLARFSRLYPLHLIVLAALVVLELAELAATSTTSLTTATPAFSGDKSPLNLLLTALMLNSFGFVQGLTWNNPSWSISAECFSYLLFPLTFRALAALPLLGLAAAVGACAIGIGAFWTFHGFTLDVYVGATFLRCLFEFPIGVVVYLLLRRHGAALRGWSPTLAWGGLLGSVAVLALADCPDILVLPSFAALILGIAAGGGSAARLLDRRPLVRLGEVSFALYIVHDAVLETLAKVAVAAQRLGHAIPPNLVGATILVLAIIAAFVAHHWIETPIRRWLMARFSRRVPRGPQPAGEIGVEPTRP